MEIWHLIYNPHRCGNRYLPVSALQGEPGSGHLVTENPAGDGASGGEGDF